MNVHAADTPPPVVKLGGSLLDMAELPERLRQLMSRRRCERPLLVVGGGKAADVVRHAYRQHHLDEDRAHWLAIRAMGFNARVLAAVLPACRVVDDMHGAAQSRLQGHVPILDPWKMLRQAEREDETAGPGLVPPHSWDVTSDSIAAWVAQRTGARELLLLKSCCARQEINVEEAARLGLVDPYFPRASAGLQVTWMNLRVPGTSAVRLQTGKTARHC